jgi:hypothetical protein
MQFLYSFDLCGKTLLAIVSSFLFLTSCSGNNSKDDQKVQAFIDQLRFSDTAFQECVASAAKENSWSSYSEVTELICPTMYISSTEGVERFSNLSTLIIIANGLTEIDVTQNLELTKLDLRWNRLSQIDVSKNTKLKYLDLTDSPITHIDVRNNISLETLYMWQCQLEIIDLSQNKKMRYIDISSNELTDIGLANNR